MTNNYQDSYSRFHHKPCINGEPSSNNGWIYTAYAAKVGLPIDQEKLQQCFDACKIKLGKRYEIFRSPGKDTPPISRDEILGLSALGLLAPRHLNGWHFSPYAPVTFNPFKLVPQLVQLYKFRDYRNYFWQNNLDQIYRFAFSVPLVDRHFILKNWGKFNLVYWAIAKFDSLFGADSGIRYLKYGKSLKATAAEFPSDHPIRLKAGL